MIEQPNEFSGCCRMTSNFDSLMYLYNIAEKNEEIIPFLAAIYDEAVKQLNKVKPSLYNWSRMEKHTDEYRRLYGDRYLLVQQRDFIDTAHSILDHGDYHLKCFQSGFPQIIHEIIGALKRKYFRACERPRVWLRYFQPNDFRRYRKIWEEFINLIDKEILGVNESDIRWRRLKSGWYWK